MRRAIKGSLPSPAITEPLLRRNYLGNETNLKLTACGKPDVHCMETLWRTHNQRHTLFRLQVLAVSFPSIHTAAPACACEDAWESNWSFWQLLACLFDFTVPPLIHFHFIASSYSAVCVCVCVSKQSLLFTRWNAPWHCDSCVELVSYEQSLTWNAILETHTRSDSSKTFPLLFHCVTEDEGGNNWGSRHKEKTCIPYSLWFKFHFDI